MSMKSNTPNAARDAEQKVNVMHMGTTTEAAVIGKTQPCKEQWDLMCAATKADYLAAGFVDPTAAPAPKGWSEIEAGAETPAPVVTTNKGYISLRAVEVLALGDTDERGPLPPSLVRYECGDRSADFIIATIDETEDCSEDIGVEFGADVLDEVDFARVLAWFRSEELLGVDPDAVTMTIDRVFLFNQRALVRVGSGGGVVWDAETEAARIIAGLSAEDIAYAIAPERGAYAGFCALHDVCDANMLLTGAGELPPNEESTIQWHGMLMLEITRQLLAKRAPVVSPLERANLEAAAAALLAAWDGIDGADIVALDAHMEALRSALGEEGK